MSDFPLACGIGLEPDRIQFALAVGIFHMIWVRER
jgi:hypothetical protein